MQGPAYTEFRVLLRVLDIDNETDLMCNVTLRIYPNLFSLFLFRLAALFLRV